MPTTFDRYLIGSFLVVWCICFGSLMGVYVTIDLFDNLDEFQSRSASDAVVLLRKVAGYYAYQAVFLFDRAGIPLCAVSVAILLSRLQRRNELPVLLAAGIPTYRIAVPLLAAGVPVIGLHAVNRELIVPPCFHEKYETRGESGATGHRVQALYDGASLILIDGRVIYPRLCMLDRPRFVLPPGSVSRDLTAIRAARAFYRGPTTDRPAGWLLEDCRPRFDELRLAPGGEQLVLEASRPGAMFIASDVTCDMLYRRDAGSIQHSTAELLRRIHNPTFRRLFGGKLGIEVHRRLTEPLLSLIAAFVAVPLMVRRESRSLSSNVAVCAAVLFGMFAIAQGCHSLGRSGLLSIDLAAWLPVIVTGSVAAWLSGLVQT